MTSARHLAGALLIIAPLVFTAGFTGLQMTFDYPDILRQPGGEVLTRFAAAGIDLHIYWYAMMSTAQASAALTSSLLALVNSEIRVNSRTLAASEAMAAMCQLVSSST